MKFIPFIPPPYYIEINSKQFKLNLTKLTRSELVSRACQSPLVNIKLALGKTKTKKTEVSWVRLMS